VASVRRLAAIMFTDTVGSTASAQANEAVALKLQGEQEGLVRPLFAAYQGREIKSMGDGFLVEFDSALRAVQCAVDIQQHLEERNAQSGVTPIRLRIGIHLGDVEERGTDIFGDAVNIASRIEPLASPGGLCISGPVYDQVRNKIPNRLEKLEARTLKGLRAPIDTYRVVMPWTVRERTPVPSGLTRLAVLPFANISPDPKDEYFADGLTEELITVLSQLRELRVIARTSVTPYKSTSKGVSQIGAELGVDAVLEGSVRKAGDELRVTVQLIDVGTQEHTWANTYDRKLEKIFAVQGEIATRVAESLQLELGATEAARLRSRPAVRPDSYLAYLKGRSLIHRPYEASLKEAQAQFELAVSLDDRNAAAHSGLADVAQILWDNYLTVSHATLRDAARRSAARALELDPNLAEAHASLALILWSDYDVAGAEREFKLALSLNPSYSPAHRWFAELLEAEARADEAVVEYALAEAADPLSPVTLVRSALLFLVLGRSAEAFARIQKLGDVDPDSAMYHRVLARYLWSQSDVDRSSQEWKRALELEPESQLKRGARALIFAIVGERERAVTLLREEEVLGPESAWGAALVGEAYGLLEKLDDCFRWLERARELGLTDVGGLRLDPLDEPIRNDPRFLGWLKKMNLA